MSGTLESPTMMPWDEAAAAGSQLIVYMLLVIDANPFAANGMGWLAIYRAAEEGHLEIVRF
ncbi:hypothetical protein V2A60_008054 [Cordyceps javanica]